MAATVPSRHMPQACASTLDQGRPSTKPAWMALEQLPSGRLACVTATSQVAKTLWHTRQRAELSMHLSTKALKGLRSPWRLRRCWTRARDDEKQHAASAGHCVQIAKPWRSMKAGSVGSSRHT